MRCFALKLAVVTIINMMNRQLVFAALAALVVCAYGASDEILKLPGLSEHIDFKQYAGYIPVDAEGKREMFYWFVESQNNASADPLVLWLNGGPGCSSLGGLLSENGPFFPNRDGQTLQLNPYSWNKVANVIYLESPAGVGFSYSKNKSDYTVGDVRTANDTLTFLLRFMEKYPSYAGRDFWITGESYGGHYIPNAALRIVNYNAAVSNSPLNLAGFMAGNPWTVAPIDNRGAVEFWWTHAIASKEIADQMDEVCDWSNMGPLKSSNRVLSKQFRQTSRSSKVDPEKCDELANTAQQAMTRINIYDIYENACLASANADGQQLLKHIARIDGHPLQKLAGGIVESVGSMDPCVELNLASYINQPEVMEAIHAKYVDTKSWHQCSERVNYSYTDLLASMIPVYEQLFKHDLHILVYSGDVDGVVPYTGTREWIASLNMTVETPFSAWYASDYQTAGFYVKYDQLTFATVREAGHMVPYAQPQRALDMFQRFLAGTFPIPVVPPTENSSPQRKQ